MGFSPTQPDCSVLEQDERRSVAFYVSSSRALDDFKSLTRFFFVLLFALRCFPRRACSSRLVGTCSEEHDEDGWDRRRRSCFLSPSVPHLVSIDASSFKFANSSYDSRLLLHQDFKLKATVLYISRFARPSPSLLLSSSLFPFADVFFPSLLHALLLRFPLDKQPPNVGSRTNPTKLSSLPSHLSTRSIFTSPRWKDSARRLRWSSPAKQTSSLGCTGTV